MHNITLELLIHFFAIYSNDECRHLWENTIIENGKSTWTVQNDIYYALYHLKKDTFSKSSPNIPKRTVRTILHGYGLSIGTHRNFFAWESYRIFSTIIINTRIRNTAADVRTP